MPIVLKRDVDLRRVPGMEGHWRVTEVQARGSSEGVIAADDKGDLSVMGVSAERNNLCTATHHQEHHN
jgi:hypothetical protein